MDITEQKAEIIKYETTGTCCKFIQIAIQDGKILNTEFFGGCAGNLVGISALVKGMHIDEVISRFKGIPCGSKPTSCPDQLANCLIEYKTKHETKVR